MKHIIFCLTLIFMVLALAGPVRAFEKESDSGAMLARSISDKDERENRLRSYLESYRSPAAPYASVFIAEADRNNLDWKFVASIAGLESTFCKHIPNGSYNCWGWGIPTGAQSGIAFDTYAHGIATVSEGLRSNYINHGLLTVEQIGRKYAASPTWAVRVRFFMDKLEGWQAEEPSHLSITI